MHVAAFYDAQHYVVSISTAKQFVILGDIVRGVTFLVWRDSNKNLVSCLREKSPYWLYWLLILFVPLYAIAGDV